MQKTPLYDRHKALGGKIVTFAGWELPVQYQGVIQEHTATRTKAGLFDVSHMGENFVTGKDAVAALQYLTCNDVSTLYDGKAQYSAILNEHGGVVDDIIIYRYNEERFLICVNASNAQKDFEWLQKHNNTSAVFENKSSEYGQIALQGPLSEAIVKKIPELAPVASLQYFHFMDVTVAGQTVIAARTGYTGEDGFEFFVPTAATESLWNLLLEVGGEDGLVPCGLGARDSLRLEACYPLHGHELSDDVLALESGLGWIVKPAKGDFIGKSALEKAKASGLKRKLVGFVLTDAGIAREQQSIFEKDGKEIGITTSGTKTPTVQKALGLAFVDTSHSAVGEKIFIEVRGKKLAAEVVKTPFYKR